MTGHFEYRHFESEKIARGRCFNQHIRLHRLDLEFEAEVAKEIAFRNHRRSVRMTTDRAIEVTLDFRHVRHVVEMTVRQEQEFYIGAARNHPIARSVRRIEQDVTLRCVDEITIRLKNSAAETLVLHTLLYRALIRARAPARDHFRYETSFRISFAAGNKTCILARRDFRSVLNVTAPQLSHLLHRHASRPVFLRSL